MNFFSNFFFKKDLSYIQKATNFDPSGIFIALLRKDCSTNYVRELFCKFAVPKGFKVSYPTQNTLFTINSESERQCTIKFGYNKNEERMLLANFKSKDGKNSEFFKLFWMEFAQCLCENNCLFGMTEKIPELDIQLEVKDILYHNEEILSDTFHFTNRNFFLAYVSNTAKREEIVDLLEELCKRNFLVIKFIGDLFDVYDKMMNKKCLISIGFNKNKERMIHITSQCQDLIWFKKFLVDLSVMLYTHQFLRCQQYIVDNKVYSPKRKAESRDISEFHLPKPEKILTRTFSFGSLSIASIFKEQEKNSLSLKQSELVLRNHDEESSEDEFSDDDLQDFSNFSSDQKDCLILNN